MRNYTADEIEMRRVFGNAISTQRHANGMTQIDLAKRVGVHSSLIGYAEHGKREVGFTRMIKILEACGFEVRIVKKK